MVNSFLEGLFPNYCVLCGLRSHRELPLCESCQACLAPNRHCCARCALPLPPGAASGCSILCAQCLIQAPPYNRVIAPWLYDEQMALLMHRWKFRGEQRLTALFAQLWLEERATTSTVDVIVPVPLHWWRLLRRGFNQSELLCHQLRRHCPSLGKIRADPGLLGRSRATGSQSGLTARDRSQNLRGAFKVCRPVAGLRVAIVDDVMTTGSTVTAMADVLLAAGATSVEVWCVARTPAPPN